MLVLAENQFYAKHHHHDLSIKGPASKPLIVSKLKQFFIIRQQCYIYNATGICPKIHILG